MATREGIYVRGHEIVQRYVGNRLVWEKNKLILIGSLSYRFTSSNANSVEYSLENLNGIYRLAEYEAYRSAIVVERNGRRFKNVSVNIEARTGQFNQTEGRIIIYFANPGDKYNFLSVSGSTSFYKSKR